MTNKKKVLIVATDIPSLKGGAAVRNFNLIKQYTKHGYDVTVVCLVEDASKKELAALENTPGVTIIPIALPLQTPLLMLKAIIGRRILPYMYQYRTSGLATAVAKIVAAQTPDIVQFEEITAYDAAANALRNRRNRPFVILDAHNVEQVTLEHAFDHFRPLRRAAGKFVLPNIRRIENNAASEADLVLACSDEDAKYFLQLNNHVAVVANGADCSHFAAAPKRLNHSLIFLGGTSYPPNEEALRWYFDQIHGQVKKHLPDLKIYILGSKPPDWLTHLSANDSSIVLPGYVDDVRDYLAKASIAISPMIGGSGTSLKILEYLASSKAVVSTTVGVRGINCTPGKDLLIANTADDFASAIIKICETPKLYETLCQNGRRHMEKTYDWSVIGTALMDALRIKS